MTFYPGTSEVPQETADLVAWAALGVPGVTALHAGSFGEVATYLPGRRVIGVKLDERGVEVHVVIDVGEPVLDVAQRIRDRVTDLVRRPVRVVVDDLSTSGV